MIKTKNKRWHKLGPKQSKANYPKGLKLFSPKAWAKSQAFKAL